MWRFLWPGRSLAGLLTVQKVRMIPSQCQRPMQHAISSHAAQPHGCMPHTGPRRVSKPASAVHPQSSIITAFFQLPPIHTSPCCTLPSSQARGPQQRLSVRMQATAEASGPAATHPAPVTLLSGASTPAKTSFLSSLLKGLPSSRNVGILLNSPMATLLEALGIPPPPTEGPPMRLPSGSWLGSASRDSHVHHMGQLVSRGQLQYLVVEDGPTQSPLTTAAGFDLEFASLGHVACLDTLVTAIDGPRFVSDVLSSSSLAEAGLDSGDAGERTEEEDEGGDDRTLADVLVEQVEYALVLAVQGLGSMAPEAAAQLKTLLAHLNRQALVCDLDTDNPSSAAQQSLATGRLDIDVLQQQGPGWAAEISAWGQGNGGRPHASHGVSTWRYESSRPFHPGRLLDVALSGTWPGVVRSKGYVWLATRNDYVGLWQSAGGSWQCEPSGMWVASVPESERPSDLDTSSWHPTWGDRCTQLVWTGVDMQESVLRGLLDACLLTEEEMALGPVTWATWDDPLPAWDHEDEHEHDEHDHDDHDD